MNEEIMEILEELRPDVDFHGNEHLIDEGILDSFDVINLVGELMDRFQVNIDARHILPKNFNSVENMAKLIKRLKE